MGVSAVISVIAGLVVLYAGRHTGAPAARSEQQIEEHAR
jgi:hypothetical protein